MKISVFGASGNVGRRVIWEAVNRQHVVTAVLRNPQQASDFPAVVSVRLADIANASEVARVSIGQDVMVNATRPPNSLEHEVEANTRGLLEGMLRAKARLVVVGGAASLMVPNSRGRQVIDDPQFLNPSYRHIGEASLKQYLICRDETQLDWAYLCPPAQLLPGERTGSYRIGSDELLLDSEGRSHISMEDFAVALLDEIEKPSHHQQRFTVAY